MHVFGIGLREDVEVLKESLDVKPVKGAHQLLGVAEAREGGGEAVPGEERELVLLIQILEQGRVEGNLDGHVWFRELLVDGIGW